MDVGGGSHVNKCHLLGESIIPRVRQAILIAGCALPNNFVIVISARHKYFHLEGISGVTQTKPGHEMVLLILSSIPCSDI